MRAEASQSFGPLSVLPLIHPSAWNMDSRKFVLTEFSELRPGLEFSEGARMARGYTGAVPYDPTIYLGSAAHYRYGRPAYSPELEAALTRSAGLDGIGGPGEGCEIARAPRPVFVPLIVLGLARRPG